MRDSAKRLRTPLFWGIAVLAIQAVITVSLARTEYLPSPPPLTELPLTVASWRHANDIPIEPEILEMLGPDDVLNRFYISSESAAALNLFVGYYKTQHRARNAHDPKVCLPGSGWSPVEARIIQISVADGSSSIPVNYYVISRDSSRNVVLYWYQTHKRAVPQEQLLKFSRIIETIRDNRTDMAFVRIIVPVAGDLSGATNEAVAFAKEIHPHLMRYFPNRDEHPAGAPTAAIR